MLKSIALFTVSALALEVNESDPMAYPDFLAGFMFGMTGDNYQAEFEVFYQQNSQLETFLQMSIGDLSKHGWSHHTLAAVEFGEALAVMPQALATCDSA